MKKLLKLLGALSVLFFLSSCGLTYYLAAEAIPEAINSNKAKEANKAKESYDSYDYNHKKIEKPTFMGGDIEEFREWVESHLTPLSDYNNLEGVEQMQYTIYPDGRVKAHDDVENVSTYERQLRKDLVRVINSAPQWVPGHRRGKPIYVNCKSSFIFPVSYEGMKNPPKFNGGGLAQFAEWVGSKIVYSSEIVKNKGYHGTVTVSYLIENDGRVTNVNLVNGCDPELDKQVIRIVSSSPLWSSFDISNCKKVAAIVGVDVRYGDEIALLKKEEEERIARQRRAEEERIAQQRRAEQQRIARQKYEEELAREEAARKATAAEINNGKETVAVWASSSGLWVFKLYKDETADVKMGYIDYHTTWTMKDGYIFVGGPGADTDTKAFFIKPGGELWYVTRRNVISNDGIIMHKQ